MSPAGVSPPSMDVLVVRARSWTCAIRIADVIEALRPLPVEPVAGSPAFVRGVARVRGTPTPVVDLAALLGLTSEARGERGARFVTVRAGQRRVAVEVDEVVGARRISVAQLQAAPPLLGVALQEHVAALGSLDGQMLAVLDAARLLPDELSPELPTPA